MMLVENKYIGTELSVFEKAHNWKRYFRSKFSHHLKGDVLEVGAGIGGTTLVLCDGSQNSWLCLEPDATLANELQTKITQKKLPPICSVSTQYLSDLAPTAMFDAILYMDVIEHIEDDKKELRDALKHLKKNGKLIILVPAHQYLYSAFDKKIGHFRRYSRKALKDAVPDALTKVSVRYMDSVGLLASVANKILLQKDTPSPQDIYLWDKFMIPVSRVFDRLTNFAIGKSVLGVWVNKG